MPQTEPMSAEDLGWYFWHECIDGSDFEGIDYDIEKFAKKAKERDAQRDRDLLTKAAERVDNLSSNVRMDLNTIIWAKKTILAPLSEKEGS